MKYKARFIWIPRTGGHSVRASLITANAPVKYASHKIIDDGLFTFTFVRNPYERLVSLFFCPFWRDRYEDSLRTFEALCEHVFKYTLPIPIWKGKMMESPRPQHLGNNQIDWLVHGCDLIGRFENIQEDFNKVCDAIDEPRKEIPHKAKSLPYDHYSKYYTEDLKERAIEFYKPDCEMFGYKFEEA